MDHPLNILLKALFLEMVFLLLSTPVLAEEHKNIEFYNTGKILPANLPFSEIVRVGNTLYLSGQIGIRPGTLKLIPGGMKEQAIQTMENIKSTLESNGFSMNNIVKCTVMLADISQWGAFNEIYKTYFKKPYPVRSAFGANGLGLGALLEVECLGAI